MSEEDKLNKEIALDLLDIFSGFLGNNPKTNLIKEKLRKEIRKERKMITQCSHCGDVSRVQNKGNGCHTCQRGVMLEIQDDQPKEIKKNHAKKD